MDPKTLTRAQLIQAYHDCKTPEEKTALYWSSEVLQGIYSRANHGPKPAEDKAEGSQPATAPAA